MKNKYLPAIYKFGREVIIDSLYHASSSICFDGILTNKGRIKPSKKIAKDRFFLFSGTSVYKGRPEISETIATTLDWGWACEFARKTIFSIERARRLSELCSEFDGLDTIQQAEEFRQRASDLGVAVYREIHKVKNDAGEYRIMHQKVKENAARQIALYERLDTEEREKVDHAFAVIYGFAYTDIQEKNFGGEDSASEMQVYQEIDLRKVLSHLYCDADDMNKAEELLARLDPKKEVSLKAIQAVDILLDEMNQSDEISVTKRERLRVPWR